MIRSLIDNAIKYTPEGGQITVAAEEIEKAVVISVSDTGKGIPESDLPHIFDKFYRASLEPKDKTGTAAPGVGPGLYLAQHIVSQLDGQISVESKEGQGTTVSIALPEEVAAEGSEESADVKAFVGS